MAQAGLMGFQQVELFVACRNLKDLDTFSKSDPFVRVLMFNKQSNQWMQFDQTEVINNNLNPEFSKTFKVDYIFEEQQHLRFEVLDFDDKRNSEMIGHVTTTIHAIMGSKGQTLILDIAVEGKKKPTGKLIIRGEEVAGCSDMLWLELGANNIENVEWFSKSDPFLIFYRLREDSTWLRVYNTEYISSNLNPVWKGFHIKVQTLCNGDLFRPIKIEVWDNESSGNHRFIGQCEASIDNLIKEGKNGFPFINPKKQQKKKSYKNSGILKVRNASIRRDYTFLQYIQGNCNISLMVAIDFTASNGLPTNPSSLHYRNPNSMNDYEKAIWAVGDILINYDTSKTVPVWGFGGSPVQGLPVSHCFPINGNPHNPEVFGVQGILGAYRQCLDRVYLNGPTLFSQILRTVVEVSSKPWNAENQYYHILLIITDGAIHDMNEAKELIVTASNYPLSIIIVGVGNADFSAMEALDSDDALLRDHKGRTASRDIVQFVPFRKFQGNPYMLAKEVLAEVPAQLTGYMRQHNLAPIPKKEIRFSQLNIPAPITTDNPQNFNLTAPMIQGFGAQLTGFINKSEESKAPQAYSNNQPPLVNYPTQQPVPTQDYAQSQFQRPLSYQPGQVPPAYQQGQVPPTYQQGQVPPTYQQGQVPTTYQQVQAHPTYQQGQVPPTYQQGQVPPTYQQGQGPSQYAYVQPSYQGQPGVSGGYPTGQPPIPNQALSQGFMGLLQRSQGNQQNQEGAPPSAPSAPSE